MSQKKQNQQQEKKKTQKKLRAKRDIWKTEKCKASRLVREARKAKKKIRQLARRANLGKPFRGLLENRVCWLQRHVNSCADHAYKLGYRGNI